MTRVFRNREEAERAGFTSNGPDPRPLMVYRFEPAGHLACKSISAIVRSPLECTLAEALEAVQRLAGHCPCCGEMRKDPHKPDCKLSLALKAFRGEGERG